MPPSWSAPAVIPGTAGVAASAPAADVFHNGTEVDLYYRDADNGIHESVYSDATGWSAPFELPGTAGVTTSAPAADVFRNGTEVDVYYRTGDGGIGESAYSDANGWSSAG